MRRWIVQTFVTWSERVADAVRSVARRASPFLRFGQWFIRMAIFAWHRRDALTVLARWPILRRIDRPLAFLLRLEPRMLSSRVIVNRVPFPGTIAERASSWLWENHSVGTGIWLSLLIGIGMCSVALGASSVFSIPMWGLKGDIDGIPTMIIAAAAYLGGLFGFLQAVTIFAVQLRTQQDTSTLPLTPLIARRYFTFFVLGAIAGVTIANLVGALAAPVLPVSRCALGALSWLNLLAVPGATIAALWYLATIVSEAGEADMDVALPILRATMRAQTHAEAIQIERLNEYGRCLEAAGIKYDPFAGTSLRAGIAVTARIPFGHPGTVRDLDCYRLSKVAQTLKTVPSSPQAAVTIALGQTVQDDNAMILTWESPANPKTTEPAKAPVDENLRKALQSVLAGLFIVQRRPWHDR